MPTIFPSLESYKAAKSGRPATKSVEDPLAKYYDALGFWTTGAIQDGDKPLPQIIEIKERAAAKKLAQRGGRPLAESDPELIAMLASYYATGGAPAAVAAVVAPAPKGKP